MIQLLIDCTFQALLMIYSCFIGLFFYLPRPLLDARGAATLILFLEKIILFLRVSLVLLSNFIAVSLVVIISFLTIYQFSYQYIIKCSSFIYCFFLSNILIFNFIFRILEDSQNLFQLPMSNCQALQQQKISNRSHQTIT